MGVSLFQVADGQAKWVLVNAVKGQRESSRFPELNSLGVGLSDQLMLLHAHFVFLFLAWKLLEKKVNELNIVECTT